jgi:hypothetical protein
MYGAMIIQGKRWVWDYARDIPVLESEMTKEQLRESERIKWESVREAVAPAHDPQQPPLF